MTSDVTPPKPSSYTAGMLHCRNISRASYECCRNCQHQNKPASTAMYKDELAHDCRQDFQIWRPPPSRILKNSKRSVLCRGPMCVIVPIFAQIGPMVAEISRFYGLFMDGQNTRVGYKRNGERQIFDIAEKVLLLIHDLLFSLSLQ